MLRINISKMLALSHQHCRESNANNTRDAFFRIVSTRSSAWAFEVLVLGICHVVPWIIMRYEWCCHVLEWKGGFILHGAGQPFMTTTMLRSFDKPCSAFWFLIIRLYIQKINTIIILIFYLFVFYRNINLNLSYLYVIIFQTVTRKCSYTFNM